jgi:hypothetical protein
VKLNRRLLLVLLAVALVVGFVALVWHGPREPSHQGISLSEWLSAYRPIGARAPGSQQAADAVRHIGTNALPFLVSWIEDYRNPPPWRARLLSYAWKPGSPGRKILLETIAKPEVRAERASWGFQILGEAARPAIPDLVRVANQGDPGSSTAATAALVYLGKDALLPLLALMTNSAPVVRYQAKQSMSNMEYLGPNAHPGVVLLIHNLSDPDPELATSAAEVLGWLQLESDITVPALVECCAHSSNKDLRMAAAFGLMMFGGSARPAVPALVKMLHDPSLRIRELTTNALQKIAPEALQKAEPP